MQKLSTRSWALAVSSWLTPKFVMWITFEVRLLFTLLISPWAHSSGVGSVCSLTSGMVGSPTLRLVCPASWDGLVSSEIYLNFLILVLRIYIYVYITSNSIYIPGRCCYIYCCYYWPQLYLLVVISVVIHLLAMSCQAFPVICINKVEKFRGQKLLCSCVL